MGSFRLPWLVFIISFTVFSGMVDVYSQYLENQKTILLQFKHSLIFNASLSSKLVLWNSSMDCCSWVGVTCSSGHVTALDLNNESITGGVNSSSSLFHLQYLQRLNLAYNKFNNSEISPEFGYKRDSKEPAGDAFKLNHPESLMFINNCNVILRAVMEKSGDVDDCISTSEAAEIAASLNKEEINNLPLPGQVDFINGGRKRGKEKDCMMFQQL